MKEKKRKKVRTKRKRKRKTKSKFLLKQIVKGLGEDDRQEENDKHCL